MTECYIIGCGQHGQQVRGWLEAERRYRVLGWLDAKSKFLGVTISGLQVKGLPSHFPTTPAVLGIGADCQARDHYLQSRHRCYSVIHPLADVPMAVRTSYGTVVGPHAMVDETSLDFSTGIVVHAGAQVHHHCTIGRSVFIGPGAVICGGCTVEDLVMIGANATISPGVTIGREAKIGAGTTITKDIHPRANMIQLPAITTSDYKAFKSGLKDGSLDALFAARS